MYFYQLFSLPLPFPFPNLPHDTNTLEVLLLIQDTSHQGSYFGPLNWEHPSILPWAPLVAQVVKNLAAVWEVWVWSLGQEDALEKRMATHSSIFCPENPTDREAWWATVHGVAKSRTPLSDQHCTLIVFYAFWVRNFKQTWPSLAPHLLHYNSL